ncbi:MAG: hypothetical protein WC992_06335 [Acholeplasmataceae bacterium]|jgi:hypothetical protein
MANKYPLSPLRVVVGDEDEPIRLVTDDDAACLVAEVVTENTTTEQAVADAVLFSRAADLLDNLRRLVERSRELREALTTGEEVEQALDQMDEDLLRQCEESCQEAVATPPGRSRFTVEITASTEVEAYDPAEAVGKVATRRQGGGVFPERWTVLGSGGRRWVFRSGEWREVAG